MIHPLFNGKDNLFMNTVLLLLEFIRVFYLQDIQAVT